MSASTRFSNPKFESLRSGQHRLAMGSREDLVLPIQTALRDLGFALPGGPDGTFGAQTKKAVSNFQRHAVTAWPEVSVHGEIDAPTLHALDDLSPPEGAQGQRWNVPAPHFAGRAVRVVVVKSEHRTFLYDGTGALLRIFPNAVGAKHSPTDEGLKVVWTKLDEREARNAGNKLYGQPLVFGPRILDLRWADGRPSGEELHGTSAPHALGEDVSHGCVRHDNTDIITIYDALAKGDLVAIVSHVNDSQLTPPTRLSI
ncbi:MAG: murein L,D-transpeptidase [Myxococcaceae bacterium]|nr:MAG: murein L,D-transpeptidase [Myxococcaceae bacterium]